MWISYSRRPLQVDEICQAIAIRRGANDLNSDNIPTISTLLDCCQGLVTMDKAASAVRLIHFTLQEHLCAHPNLFGRTHAKMAETCLTYLNFRHVKGLPADSSADPQTTPFLEYSALYWGAHMRMELSGRAKKLALLLLHQFDRHISAKTLGESIGGEFIGRAFPGTRIPNREGFSVLHCIQ